MNVFFVFTRSISGNMGINKKFQDNSHEIAHGKKDPSKFLKIKKCLIKDDVTIVVKVYNSIFVLDENGCFI